MAGRLRQTVLDDAVALAGRSGAARPDRPDRHRPPQRSVSLLAAGKNGPVGSESAVEAGAAQPGRFGEVDADVAVRPERHCPPRTRKFKKALSGARLSSRVEKIEWR